VKRPAARAPRPARRSWGNVRYLIACPAMTDSGMVSFDVPREWHVEHGSPGAGLVPFRLDGRVGSLEEVTFLADCVSFDHDMPTVVRPKAHSRDAMRRTIDPLFPWLPAQEETLGYYASVEDMMGSASELRLGDVLLGLRYRERPALLRFNPRFAGVEEALGLYTMATRQVEVLSEYLCLYRVLEWAKKDDGIRYAERHMNTLITHDYGELWGYERGGGLRRRNIFKMYAARCRKRLRELGAQGRSDHEIAVHLYAIRNSLAHGKSKFTLDRAANVAEIGRDLLILKLLARLVIEKVP
jgi:hypothetical protein